MAAIIRQLSIHTLQNASHLLNFHCTPAIAAAAAGDNCFQCDQTACQKICQMFKRGAKIVPN